MTLSRTDKPWGYEVLVASTERYAGKILFIRAGQRLSLQHHHSKDETLYLLDGDTHLELEGDKGLREYVMAIDQSYHIEPGRRHRLKAVSDARVLEISTPELDDVIRWDDDYGRTTCGLAVPDVPFA